MFATSLIRIEPHDAYVSIRAKKSLKLFIFSTMIFRLQDARVGNDAHADELVFEESILCNRAEMCCVMHCVVMAQWQILTRVLTFLTAISRYTSIRVVKGTHSEYLFRVLRLKLKYNTFIRSRYSFCSKNLFGTLTRWLYVLL